MHISRSLWINDRYYRTNKNLFAETYQQTNIKFYNHDTLSILLKIPFPSPTLCNNLVFMYLFVVKNIYNLIFN